MPIMLRRTHRRIVAELQRRIDMLRHEVHDERKLRHRAEDRLAEATARHRPSTPGALPTGQTGRSRRSEQPALATQNAPASTTDDIILLGGYIHLQTQAVGGGGRVTEQSAGAIEDTGAFVTGGSFGGDRHDTGGAISSSSSSDSSSSSSSSSSDSSSGGSD